MDPFKPHLKGNGIMTATFLPPTLGRKLAAIFTATALFPLSPPSPVAAQTPEEEVVRVVSQLFEGMRTRDANLLASLFHPDARMTGTGLRDGSHRVTVNPPSGWIESVTSYTDGVIDERFYDPVVEVSGPLASVWTEYDLFVGGEFRHCGVDAFHLALTDDGWKIVHVADTRVTEGCPQR
jgi:hypothetical protein